MHPQANYVSQMVVVGLVCPLPLDKQLNILISGSNLRDFTTYGPFALSSDDLISEETTVPA